MGSEYINVDQFIADAAADAAVTRTELEDLIVLADDRIRITGQLIEAGSDRHLWSENFYRELIGQTHCVRVRYSF